VPEQPRTASLGTSPRLHAWVAVVVGYCLILQVLLAGVVATKSSIAAAFQPDDRFVICTSADDGDRGAAPDPFKAPGCGQACAACLLNAGAMPVGQVLFSQIEIVIAVLFAASESSRAGSQRSPKSAQGPPPAA
jgi:hypothetical protein